MKTVPLTINHFDLGITQWQGRDVPYLRLTGSDPAHDQLFIFPGDAGIDLVTLIDGAAASPVVQALRARHPRH